MGTGTFFRRTLFRPLNKVDIFSTSNKMGHIFDQYKKWTYFQQLKMTQKLMKLMMLNILIR